MTKSVTKIELRKVWEQRVAAFKASGQSASAWCAAQDLKPHQLWYWLRKHNPVNTPNVKPFQWMSVEIADQGYSLPGNVLLVRVGQAVVEVQPGFNPALLSDVVRTLAGICWMTLA